MRAFRLRAVQFVELAKGDFQLRFFVWQDGLCFVTNGLHAFGFCSRAVADADVAFTESEHDAARPFVVQRPRRSRKAALLSLPSVNVHAAKVCEGNSWRVPTTFACLCRLDGLCTAYSELAPVEARLSPHCVSFAFW